MHESCSESTLEAPTKRGESEWKTAASVEGESKLSPGFHRVAEQGDAGLVSPYCNRSDCGNHQSQFLQTSMPDRHCHLKQRSSLRIQQLDMLLHLIETRSISETADKLGLTQSAVTKSLQELESIFSVRLFDRTSRGLRPTAYGSALERYAHDAVVGLQSAHEAIRTLRFGERGHVGIGLVPGIGQGLVARALQRIRAGHPELSIELQVDLTVPLLDALHAGLIDIALVHPAPGLDLGRFSLVPAGNEPLYAMVHPAHPILAVEPRSRTDDTVAWALPPRDEPVRQLVEAAMLQGGFPTPQDVIELPLHAGAAELAQQLDVIVALPESLALPYVQRGALQRLDLPFVMPSLTLGLLRARHVDCSAGAALVLRELQGVIADLGPEHTIGGQASDQRRTAKVMA